jgi:hypothetical protein
MTSTQRRRLRLSRDTIIFLLGIAGIIYETVVENGDKPTLLILFGAMIGLPAFLHGDEQVKKALHPPPEPEPEKQPLKPEADQ